MNILRLFETFRTYKTVKNTKTIQNNEFFFDILPNYCMTKGFEKCELI